MRYIFHQLKFCELAKALCSVSSRKMELAKVYLLRTQIVLE